MQLHSPTAAAACTVASAKAVEVAPAALPVTPVGLLLLHIVTPPILHSSPKAAAAAITVAGRELPAGVVERKAMSVLCGPAPQDNFQLQM